MKVLSFDVGIINLAYCIFETTTSKILHWGIIDLKVHGFSGKVPSGNGALAKSANDIHISLIHELDTLKFLLDVDYVVIEKQPSFNPKMRIIGGCLQSYFYIRGIVDKPHQKITSIEFFSPKHKLKCYTGPELTIESKAKSKYTQTKKMGILITKEKLDEFEETPENKMLFETSKKKDDLADSYLQAITFSIFKKLNKSKPILFIEENVKVLSKTQIKNQLKKYLDAKVKVLNVQELLQPPQTNFIQTMESMNPELKKNILERWNITSFETTSFMDDLSMKKYPKLYYL
jgi:hypothetical protein